MKPENEQPKVKREREREKIQPMLQRSKHVSGELWNMYGICVAGSKAVALLYTLRSAGLVRFTGKRG